MQSCSYTGNIFLLASRLPNKRHVFPLSKPCAMSPKGSPFDEQNRLALDRVKSIKSLLGVKGLKEIVFLKKTLLQYETRRTFCLIKIRNSECFLFTDEKQSSTTIKAMNHARNQLMVIFCHGPCLTLELRFHAFLSYK